MNAFLAAAHNTAELDACMFTACRLSTSLTLTQRQWLEANTIDLSPNPNDWQPEFRFIWEMMLTDRLEAEE